MKNIWYLVLCILGTSTFLQAQAQHLYTKPSRFYMRFETGGGQIERALVTNDIETSRDHKFSISKPIVRKLAYLLGYQISPHFSIESGMYIYAWEEDMNYTNVLQNQEIGFSTDEMMTGLPIRVKADLPLLKGQLHLFVSVGGQISKQYHSTQNSIFQQWAQQQKDLIQFAEYYEANPQAKARAEMQISYIQTPPRGQKFFLSEAELGLDTRLTKTISLYISKVFLAEYNETKNFVIGYAEKGVVKDKIHVVGERFVSNISVGIQFRPLSAYKQ